LNLNVGFGKKKRVVGGRGGKTMCWKKNKHEERKRRRRKRIGCGGIKKPQRKKSVRINWGGGKGQARTGLCTKNSEKKRGPALMWRGTRLKAFFGQEGERWFHSKGTATRHRWDQEN